MDYVSMFQSSVLARTLRDMVIGADVGGINSEDQPAPSPLDRHSLR